MLLKLRTYLEMIRFSHTVFALPFALMGAVLAAGGIPSGDKLLWILMAMVGARSGAMGVNRLADRIQLQVAPAEALPFPSESFDATTVAFGLRNVPDRQRGLREMCRVLRPGGRAVILEFTIPPGRLFRGVYLWYFHRVLPWIGRLVSGHPSAYSYLPASVTDFPSPEGLVVWMRDAGFREVSDRLLTGGIVAIHVGRK